MLTERAVSELKAAFGQHEALTGHEQELLSQLSGHLRRAFRTASRMGFAQDAALEALERLVGVGWAERGFATKCTACGLASFTPLSAQAALGETRCPVCASAAEFTRNQHGPAVHYRLDARVDRANAQGMIAHLMAIGVLADRCGPAYLMPGVDLVFADGLKRETDLFGVCDGRLVSGEVKMSGTSFDEKEIDKDVDVAARLGVDVHVMAAATPIPPEAKQLAEARCLSRGIELVVLEADDLRA